MRKYLPKIIFGIVLGAILIGAGIHLVHAATVSVPTIPKPDLLPGPDETTTQLEVQNYFRNQAIPTFISAILGLISGLALLALIYSGVRFLTAYGEEEAITSAKKIATWSILGFVLALLSYAIVSIVNTMAYPDEAGYTVENQEQVIYDDI